MSGFIVTQGIVVKVEHREQAIVSGSGGGGGVTTLPDGRVIGVQHSSTISTQIQSKDVIWLRTDSGQETEFIINGDTFSCREGHKLAFICSDGVILVARNFTSGKTSKYFTPESVRGAFAPPSENAGAAIVLALILGAGGSAAIAYAAQNNAPINDPTWLFGSLLIFPPMIFVLLFKKNKVKRIAQKEADVEIRLFIDQLEALEKNLT